MVGRAYAGSVPRRDRPTARRGQANLVALVVALFALTTVTVIAVAMANGALADQRRESAERHAAAAVADRLVAADSPLTTRANVVGAERVDDLSVADLRRRYPVLDGRSVRVTLGDRVIAADGTPGGGAEMSRIVYVARTTRLTVTPSLTAGNRLTLPRRTPRAILEIRPRSNVSVRVVRANDRTVLRDPDGLAGRHTISLSRDETARLTFEASGALQRGAVEATLFPRQTKRTRLTVTVDD